MNAPHHTTASRLSPLFTAPGVGDAVAEPGPLGWAERTASFVGAVGYDQPPAAVHPLADRRHPLAVCVPDGYEPGYAYPLVLWLHDAGEDERSLVPVMRGVSERNYLGVAVRGGRCGTADEPVHGWDDDAVRALSDRLPTLLAAVRGEWARAPAAGVSGGVRGRGRRRRRGAGGEPRAVRRGGAAGRGHAAVRLRRPLPGRRVLLGDCGEQDRLGLPELLAAGRRYREAGAEVTARVYPGADDGAMLGHIDRWLMAGVCSL